jgi:glyoxylase-like metal-dependent hydrolase (beta-lactamase superfamily II)
MIEIRALVDEGLGNSSYLVDLGDGRALAVDPARDPRPYLAATGARGVRLAFTAETHLHADFVSGTTHKPSTASLAGLAAAALGVRALARHRR